MSTTEIMRRMLDERGVEWTAPDESWNQDSITYWKVGSIKWVAFESENDTLWLNCNSVTDLTPAQAIAATLGRGECKPMTYDNGYLMDHIEPGEYYEFWEPACACSECGELIPMRKFCPNCGAKIVDPTTNAVDAEVSYG